MTDENAASIALENLMIKAPKPFDLSRRSLLAAGLASLFASGAATAANARDPLATMRAIYQDAVKGQMPSWIDKGLRAQYLSRSLVALWAKTDKRIVPGDEGPIDFDIVTDTNGLELSDFSLAVEKQDAKTATIAVTLIYKEGDASPKPKVQRYNLVLEGGQWKIDEIRGDKWSVRDLLTNFLRP
jgi:hypothetical protein